MDVPRRAYRVACWLGLAILTASAASQRERPEDRYRALAEATPEDDAGAQYKLGRWCLEHWLPERARTHFRRVVQLDPGHTQAHERLGHVEHDGQWVAPGQRDRLELAEKQAGLATADLSQRVELASWCEERGLFAAADQLYREILERDSSHERARAALDGAAESKLAKLVEAYVQGDERIRARALATLRKKRISSDDIGKWAYFVRAQLRKHRPLHSGAEVAQVSHPQFPLRYRLLGKKTGEDLSLLIVLHSGGPSTPINDMTWSALVRHRGAPYDLIAMPRVHDDTTGAGWTFESGTTGVEAMLRELLRSYPIDPNRVHLNGYSMGGYGTCFIGCLEPDRFAALGVCAAGHSGGNARVANLMHVPVTIHIGEQDLESDHIGTSRDFRDQLEAAQEREPGFYPHHYREYAGTGHQLPPEAQVETFRWQATFTRNPAPRRIVWEPFTSDRYRTHKHYYYWLHVPEPRSGMRIDARVVGNQVIVETKSVPSFRVLLNAQLIDPRKPVMVTVNGKTVHRKRLTANLGALVETYAAREDRELVYPYQVFIGKRR